MARRRGSSSTALVRRSGGGSNPVVIVSQPSSPRRRSLSRAGRAVGRRIGHHARRGATAAARVAYEEKTALAAVGGAGLVGYLDAAGMLDFIPNLGLGRVPELAIGTYLAGRFFKKDQLRKAGIGLAAAAAFNFGAEEGAKSKKK
jgi:hypothetical protein